MKKRRVIAILSLEPFPLRHSHHVIDRGIVGMRHAVIDFWRLWHLRYNFRRFGCDKGTGVLCRYVLQPLALRDVEDGIQTEQWDFLQLTRFLVRDLHLFPEHDGAGFLALLHTAAKLDGLPEREPVR